MVTRKTFYPWRAKKLVLWDKTDFENPKKERTKEEVHADADVKTAPQSLREGGICNDTKIQNMETLSETVRFGRRQSSTFSASTLCPAYMRISNNFVSILFSKQLWRLKVTRLTRHIQKVRERAAQEVWKKPSSIEKNNQHGAGSCHNSWIRPRVESFVSREAWVILDREWKHPQKFNLGLVTEVERTCQAM